MTGLVNHQVLFREGADHQGSQANVALLQFA